MAEADTVSVLRRYADAWSRNDGAAVMALRSDEIEHHAPGLGPLVGGVGRKQAFLDHAAVFEELGGTIEVIGFHDLPASDDHGVSLVHERAVRGERTLDVNRVVGYHVRDGLIVDTWSHDYDLYALDAFWT